jgi:hypothetical protein
MRSRLSVLRTLIVFFALSGIARGQNLVEVGFGVRGGLVANGSVQAFRLCIDTACAFDPSPSFATDRLSGTVGPTVNVLLFDRVEVRFEAVHRRFGYQVDHTIFPPNNVETTQGTVWEYPLLATYHFGSGPIRPFAGGGLSLRTTETLSSQTAFSGITPAPLVFRTSGSLSPPPPYYLVAGIDGRISHVSIRPEFRYSHFPVDEGSSAEATLKPNQFEFLVSVSVQFLLKKLDAHR